MDRARSWSLRCLPTQFRAEAIHLVRQIWTWCTGTGITTVERQSIITTEYSAMPRRCQLPRFDLILFNPHMETTGIDNFVSRTLPFLQFTAVYLPFRQTGQHEHYSLLKGDWKQKRCCDHPLEMAQNICIAVLHDLGFAYVRQQSSERNVVGYWEFVHNEQGKVWRDLDRKWQELSQLAIDDKSRNSPQQLSHASTSQKRLSPKDPTDAVIPTKTRKNNARAAVPVVLERIRSHQTVILL